MLKVPFLYSNSMLDPAISFNGYVCRQDTTNRDSASQRAVQTDIRRGKASRLFTCLPDDVDVTIEVGNWSNQRGRLRRCGRSRRLGCGGRDGLP